VAAGVNIREGLSDAPKTEEELADSEVRAVASGKRSRGVSKRKKERASRTASRRQSTEKVCRRAARAVVQTRPRRSKQCVGQS